MSFLSKNIYFFILISLSFSYIPTTITGFVYDVNQKPIDNVLILSEIDQTYSKSDGSFTLLYKENEKISFTRIGYHESIIKIDYFDSKNIVTLIEKTVNLNEIKISELTGDIKLHNSTQDVHIFSEENFKSSDSHFQDIINQIPNFNFSGGTSRPRYFQIRGIGERSQYAGEGGANYYVATILDDIDLSGIGMPLFLDDIKQIEIYQGPQSYAYGHNAMAGLINIQTLDPSINKESKSKITLGSGHSPSINISQYSNIGTLFSKKILINNFIQGIYEDGFTYNSFLNEPKNVKDEYIGKFKLLFIPNDLFSSKLTFINSKLDNGYDAWTPDNNADTTYTNQPGKDSQNLIAISLKNEIKFKKIKIIDIANYLISNLEHSYDADWGNDSFWLKDPYNYDPYYYGGYEPYEYYQKELRERIMFSNDIRILNQNIKPNPNLNLSNTLGFYYKNLVEIDTATGWILGGEDIALKSKFTINNFAFYNELKMKLEKIKITLNLRLEKNKLNYIATHNRSNNTITKDTIDVSDNLIGSRISFLYTVNNRNNIYFSISNGFKAGGINQNPTLCGTEQFFEPENNINLDFGLRYIDEKAAFNINAFYMHRNNIQLNLSSQLEGDNPSTFYFYTANASDGYNYGLNIDLSLMLTKTFEGYFKIGFLETMINSYEYMIDDILITNLSREASHAPFYTYSFGFTKYYKNLYLSSDINGKDAFYFSDSHNEKSDPYFIVNLNLGYKINKNMEISIWGKNILDNKYPIRAFYFALEPPNWEDKLYLSYGDPINIGITFRYDINDIPYFGF